MSTVTAPTPDAGRLRALLERELAPVLSEGAVTVDSDVVTAYSSDEALFCPADGAVALVRAATVEDVQATLCFATEHRIPVVPQGARTGLSGGANAVPRCLLLSVEKMRRIIDIDPAERTVTVEPGIITDQDPAAFIQDGGIGGIPGDTESPGDARHGQVESPRHVRRLWCVPASVGSGFLGS